MAIHPLWNTYPSFQKELMETQKIMDNAVKIRNKEITEALQLFFQSGGKLLRPAYFLLFTKFGEIENNQKKYQLAASLEILHTATLIHDDIIDESPLRRGLPSIQASFGKDIAVYSGDFLFTVYFQLLANSVNDFSYINLNATNMKRILIGELDQMHLKYNPQITIKEYLRHIKGKTAQLFQLSCYEGAHYANSSKYVQILGQRIGYNIGMAFQILDDILDYSASEEELHKPVLEDVKLGHYTLPLILAMEQNREAFRPILSKGRDLTTTDTQALVEKIQQYHGLEQAQKLATRYTNKALSGIEKLPDIPEKEILIQITQKLLVRND